MFSPRQRAAFEIALVAVPGVLNVATFGVPHAKTVLVLASLVVWLAYAAARVRADRGVLRAWGFGWDALRAAATPLVAVTAALTALALVYGVAVGHVPPPHGFWVVLALYPIWGVAQQFLLNPILARNFEQFVPAGAALAAAALGYSLSHAPDWPMVALTLPAGVLWVWLYRRFPSLWAIGIAHGVIGTCAYYLVLGRDPFSKLFN
ncbi:MAG: type II CAAX prenyl endopeptidase Rce1 family protein [Thermoanaerobaculales bacterium]